MIDNALLTDVLSLTFYQSDEESRFILSNVIRHHREVTKRAKAEVSPLLALCVEYFQECMDPEIDSTSSDQINTVLLRIAHLKGEEVKRIESGLERIAAGRETVSQRKVHNLKQLIKDKLRVLRAETELRQLFRKCSDFVDGEGDAEERSNAIQQIKVKMEDLQNHFSSDLEMAETLNEVDFSNPKSIEKALIQHEDRKTGGGFVWGWQALNEWFAHCGGGWRPGQSLMIAGAADCGKSYLIRLIVQWAAMHNKPLNKKSRKRKAIVYICLESEVDKITHDFFEGAWMTDNPGEPIPTNWNPLQKSEYTHKFFGRRGYVLLLSRYGSSELTHADWVAIHDRTQKKYVIEFSFLDYVGIMSRLGMEEGNDATNLQVLQARNRTYCARHGIRYCTAAQLKESIKEHYAMARGVGVSVANSSWLAQCTALEKETDLMFYGNVEVNHLGESYFCLKISRYRGESLPPVNKRIFCMKFEKHGIPDDIFEEKSRAVRNHMDVDDTTALDEYEKSVEETDSTTF